MISTGHRFVTLELAKEEDLGEAQKLKDTFVMKEAFYNYAGSIRRTKLPVQYKIGFLEKLPFETYAPVNFMPHPREGGGI